MKLIWILFAMQWFTMKRQHAIKIMEDNLYFTKFKYHCMVLSTSAFYLLNGLDCLRNSTFFMPSMFTMLVEVYIG
ncbi:putative glycosyl transferase, family 14 [Lupinus albus]|uniref:Putative glycosyl transferase, family 14 n=1 Tax=Lupinus albus TaxID=3870 RepID=A0A6A4NNK9_LUPAL|nr:putative glycosyl transferase, family 14 [Lupinus albus]